VIDRRASITFSAPLFTCAPWLNAVACLAGRRGYGRYEHLLIINVSGVVSLSLPYQVFYWVSSFGDGKCLSFDIIVCLCGFLCDLHMRLDIPVNQGVDGVNSEPSVSLFDAIDEKVLFYRVSSLQCCQARQDLRISECPRVSLDLF